MWHQIQPPPAQPQSSQLRNRSTNRFGADHVLGSYQPIRLVTQQQNIASGETGQVYAQTFVAPGGSSSFHVDHYRQYASWSGGVNHDPAEVMRRPTTSAFTGVTVQVTDDRLSGFSASQTYSFNIGNGLKFTRYRTVLWHLCLLPPGAWTTVPPKPWFGV